MYAIRSYYVLVDGEESTFGETKTSSDRTLTVEFPAGTEKIEIIGTFAVPEFGTIAAMILSVAIISIIGVITSYSIHYTKLYEYPQ